MERSNKSKKTKASKLSEEDVELMWKNILYSLQECEEKSVDFISKSIHTDIKLIKMLYSYYHGTNKSNS